MHTPTKKPSRKRAPTRSSPSPRAGVVSHSRPERSKEDAPGGYRTPTFLFRHDEADAGGRILAAVGGLRDALTGRKNPVGAVQALANSVQAALQVFDQTQEAEPPPADFLAMFRLVDYCVRTNGDVWQTINVPGEILCKPVRISCKDQGALKDWLALWGGQTALDQGVTAARLDVDDLFAELFYELEQNHNVFPLEVYAGPDFQGLAMIEPTSMWVGRHYTNYALVGQAGWSVQKLADMIHPLAYSSFVTDLNIQTSHAYRVPIRPDAMEPLFGRKFAYQRYAIPAIARAGRNILERQMLMELRRATMEGFINQLIVFTVGSDNLSPNVNANLIKATNALLTSQSKERTGLLVLHHTAKGEVLTPNALDSMMGDETMAGQTQAILRDLGFSKFLIDGEIPGSGARASGTAEEFDVQFALERWGFKQRIVLKWLQHFSARYAHKTGNAALAKYPPIFTVDPIGIQQTQRIKEVLLPMAMGGHLDERTVIEQSGVSTYEQVLANKKAEEQDRELFLPKPSFNQMTVNPDGSGPKETLSERGGRPPDAQARPSRNAARASDGNSVEAQSPFPSVTDWSRDIDTQFQRMLASNGTEGGTRDRILAFVAWLMAELELKLTAAYQDGFMHWGGLGDLNNTVLADAPQGLPFHQDALRGFRDELLKHTNSPMELLSLRPRALSYASASHVTYMLGVQQAMRSHGAKFWQRILHPELSQSGPCSACVEDAMVVHPIEVAFSEPHPSGVCGMQSLTFFFSDSAPKSVAIPAAPWGMPTQSVRRVA